MSMGNQQDTRIKSNVRSYTASRDILPASPRIQIPRKRSRRAEGLHYTGTILHTLRVPTGTTRVPTKARRQPKQQITSGFGETQEFDSEEERPGICTPARRRERLMEEEREEESNSRLDEMSPVDLMPTWRVKLFDSCSFLPREDLSVNKECAHLDSDTDHSEYDNEIYSTTRSESNKRTEDDARNTLTQAASQELESKKTECGEETSSHLKPDEMETSASAQRVMGMIQEVEGIIRRVSLTTSDWIRGGSDRGDEPQSMDDGYLCDKVSLEPSLKLPQQRNQGELSAALGEALSQSLQEVLRMEGERKHLRTPEAQDELLSGAGKNLLESTRMLQSLPPHHHHYSTAPNNFSSSSPSEGEGRTSTPSPSLSTILDDSATTSYSSEGTSTLCFTSIQIQSQPE